MKSIGSMILVYDRSTEKEYPAIVRGEVTDKPGTYDVTVFDENGATARSGVTICTSREESSRRESLMLPGDDTTRSHLVHARGSIYIAYPADGTEAPAAPAEDVAAAAAEPVEAPAPAPTAEELAAEVAELRRQLAERDASAGTPA